MPDANPIGVTDQPLDMAPQGTRAAALPGTGTPEPCAPLTRDEPAALSTAALAREAAAAPPADLHAVLERLQPWQARYALALMEYGGIAVLVAKRCNVSADSVKKAQRANPDFAEACSLAVNHSADWEEAAMFRSASVGDLTPIYQKGVMVGYNRVRNTRTPNYSCGCVAG